MQQRKPRRGERNSSPRDEMGGGQFKRTLTPSSRPSWAEVFQQVQSIYLFRAYTLSASGKCQKQLFLWFFQPVLGTSLSQPVTVAWTLQRDPEDKWCLRSHPSEHSWTPPAPSSFRLLNYPLPPKLPTARWCLILPKCLSMNLGEKHSLVLTQVCVSPPTPIITLIKTLHFLISPVTLKIGILWKSRILRNSPIFSGFHDYECTCIALYSVWTIFTRNYFSWGSEPLSS